MKRQNFLDRFTGALIDLEGYAGLRFLLAALEFEASSTKNSSSKIRRMWAGVREDCRSAKLSPASGQ